MAKQESNADFVLNAATYRLHKKGCSHLKTVLTEHKRSFNTVEEAIDYCDNSIKKCLTCFYEPKNDKETNK